MKSDSAIVEIIKKLDLKTKLELLYGDGFWKIRGLEQYGYRPFLVSDGPHGLRKQVDKGDQLGIMAAYPATCFPTASLVACSFDEQLIYAMGQAIANEALAQGIAVVLGPGVNIKRNPLCGRNFEYFSEDPLLSGKMGASFIKGVQSIGVGTSLKHYAANNQETDRLSINAVIDQRALRDIYLKPFEIAVKEAHPYTVMCSYNRINGTYSSDNDWLLNTVLRKQWGFEGLVMTDWGALNDDFLARQSGLDLEMPGIGKRYKNLLRGIKKGYLSESDVNTCVENILNLHERVKNLKYGQEADYEAHFELARNIAAESTVLLRNNGILPLKTMQKVAVLGAFAANPRYQGTGSSKVNPFKLVSFLETLKNENINYEYAPGYKSNSDLIDVKLENEALALAATSDVILLFAGLPDAYESEGFDRINMKMPLSQLSLIEKVTKLGKKVVVVLACGAPIELPFANDVDALVLMYLAGEACGPAALDVLLGRINPSGKLPETWPVKYEDVLSAKYFPGDGTNVIYAESIYVGYRYFDTVNAEVRFPFGFGLSYTTFDYSNLEIIYEFVDKKVRYVVSFDVTNTGTVEGKEVAQLYVANRSKGVFKPHNELKGFAKVSLKTGETKRVTMNLCQSELRIFDITTHEPILEKGEYEFEIGASSRDIRLSKTILVEGDYASHLVDDDLPSYYKPSFPFTSNAGEFERIYQAKIPKTRNRQLRPFDKNSTLRDIEKTLVGKIIKKVVVKMAEKMTGEDVEATRKMFIESAMTMPLRGYTMSGLLSNGAIDGIVHLANRHLFRGLWCFLFKGK